MSGLKNGAMAAGDGWGAPLGVHVLGIGPKSDVEAGMSAMPPIFSSLPPVADVISEDAYSLQFDPKPTLGFIGRQRKGSKVPRYP